MTDFGQKALQTSTRYEYHFLSRGNQKQTAKNSALFWRKIEPGHLSESREQRKTFDNEPILLKSFISKGFELRNWYFNVG